MEKIFTIVVPVYNGETSIVRTLASFISNKNCISEIIIVNDYCTDNTINLVHSFDNILPIRIIMSEGKHDLSMARRTGLLNCNSEWITFVDADDCLTSSCLQYVYKELQKYQNIVVLRSLQMFYEFGTFKTENIEYNIPSCGGVFYKTNYLVQNNLLPHKKLPLSEDKYFNDKIEYFIHYCDNDKMSIQYFNYPVYEVHHDYERKSLAHSNWNDYSIQYRLLCQQYIIEDCILYPGIKSELKQEFIKNFIFCYFNYLICLETELNTIEQLQYFRQALQFFCQMFSSRKSEILTYYKNNPEVIEGLLKGAIDTNGYDLIEKPYSFEEFINSL